MEKKRQYWVFQRSEKRLGPVGTDKMHLSDLLIALEKLGIVVATPLVLASVLTAIVSLASCCIQSLKSNATRNFLLATVFGTLSMVFGIIMAASRTSAVADVIPAALALIGGVALYLITKEKEKTVEIAVSVLSFSCLLFIGTILGSYERQRSEFQAAHFKYDLQDQMRKADNELIINAYRKSRNLKPIDFSIQENN